MKRVAPSWRLCCVLPSYAISLQTTCIILSTELRYPTTELILLGLVRSMCFSLETFGGVFFSCVMSSPYVVRWWLHSPQRLHVATYNVASPTYIALVSIIWDMYSFTFSLRNTFSTWWTCDEVCSTTSIQTFVFSLQHGPHSHGVNSDFQPVGQWYSRTTDVLYGVIINRINQKLFRLLM